MESAGVTLLKGDLGGIVCARRLSRATMRNIRENVFLAFIYNAAGMPICDVVEQFLRPKAFRYAAVRILPSALVTSTGRRPLFLMNCVRPVRIPPMLRMQGFVQSCDGPVDIRRGHPALRHVVLSIATRGVGSQLNSGGRPGKAQGGRPLQAACDPGRAASRRGREGLRQRCLG